MLSIKILLYGIRRFIKSKGAIYDIYLLLWSAIDGMRCEFIRYLPGEKTLKEGPYGEYAIINWDRGTVTLGDPTGVTTWRFALDKYNNLVLHRGSVTWKTDNNLSCWRELETELKTLINDRMDKILLEE